MLKQVVTPRLRYHFPFGTDGSERLRCGIWVRGGDADKPDAFLDLVSPGGANRVIGISSNTELCEGRSLVETTERPHLLLDKIDGQPSCGAPMPLGQQAWLRVRQLFLSRFDV